VAQLSAFAVWKEGVPMGVPAASSSAHAPSSTPLGHPRSCPRSLLEIMHREGTCISQLVHRMTHVLFGVN
jgi:hypothetical protein